MNDLPKIVNWLINHFSISIFFLILVGCSSIRENERELTLYEKSKNTKTGSFSFQRIPNKYTNHKNFSNKLLNSDSTHFYFESENFKEKTSIYFYIHPNYFEENFRRYASFLNILKEKLIFTYLLKFPM